MVKVTVLYGHPKDDAAFEDYYAETHIPLALKIPNVTRFEFTRFLPDPNGGAPVYYRMAELYFADTMLLSAALASAEGQAAVDDLSRFATGGVTFLAGEAQLMTAQIAK